MSYQATSEDPAIRARLNTWRRFSACVKRFGEGKCHVWTGFLNSDGYGRIQINGKKHLVHRLMWELVVGPIPPKMTLDHLCRNRKCVNPEHLEVVTNKENTMRGVGVSSMNAKATHCLNGHEFTDENTYRSKGRSASSAFRHCRTCKAERQRNSRAKRKV